MESSNVYESDYWNVLYIFVILYKKQTGVKLPKGV